MSEIGQQQPPSPAEIFRQRIATKTPNQLAASIKDREGLLKRKSTPQEIKSRLEEELPVLREREAEMQQTGLKQVKPDLGMLAPNPPSDNEGAFRDRVARKTPEERHVSIKEREALLRRKSISDTEKARIRRELEILRNNNSTHEETTLTSSTPASEKDQKEVERTKEELLLEELLQKGRSEINQEIEGDHSENFAEKGKFHLPFLRDPADTRSLPFEVVTILPPSRDFSSKADELTRRDIYETVAIVPVSTDITEAKTKTVTRSVPVTKKPFLGIFGKETTTWEQEQYEKTYYDVVGQNPATTTEAGGIESNEKAVSFFYFASASNATNRAVRNGFHPMGDRRAGHDFTMKIVLPESSARDLAEQIKTNPRFARKVVDTFLRQRYDARAIQRYEYQMVRGQKLFDEHNGKMYMIDLLDTPADQVNQRHPFNPDNVLDLGQKQLEPTPPPSTAQTTETLSATTTNETQTEQPKTKEEEDKEIIDAVVKNGVSQIETWAFAQNIGSISSGGDGMSNIAETGKSDFLPYIHNDERSIISEFIDILGHETSYNDAFRFFSNQGVFETIGLIPLSRVELSEKKNQEAKVKPFTVTEAGGINSAEPAVALYYNANCTSAQDDNIRYPGYKDGRGRPGNSFTAKIVLPMSIARELAPHIKRNPTIVREIAERFVKERYSPRFVSNTWNTFARPPYEVWDKAKSKIYFLDALDETPEEILKPHVNKGRIFSRK